MKKELLELTDRFKQQEADAELAQQELLERGRQDVDSATTELEVRFCQIVLKMLHAECHFDAFDLF